MQAMDTGWPPPELLVTVSTTHAISLPASRKLHRRDHALGCAGARSEVASAAHTRPHHRSPAGMHSWRHRRLAGSSMRVSCELWSEVQGTPLEAAHVHIALEGVVRAGAMRRGQVHRYCALGLCIRPAHDLRSCSARSRLSHDGSTI